MGRSVTYLSGSDCTTVIWRRGRDSNPRDPFGPNGFQDRRFQPLTHPSVSNYNQLLHLVELLVTLSTPVAALVQGVTKLSLNPSSFAMAFRLESRFVCV